MNRLFAWFLLLALSPFVSWAQSESDPLVVKVTSQPCMDPSKKLSGSGVLFRSGNQVFAITSEHVVYHSNERLCHFIESPEVEKQRVHLISADWEKGMALLRMNTTENTAKIPQLDEIISNGDSSSMAVSKGFPVKSNDVLVDVGFSVIMKSSRRHFIPGLASMVETRGLHGEYGMSGGGVFDQRGKLAGLLSHQALKAETGSPTRVIELGSEDIANHLLVIPKNEVVPWIKETLSNPHRETLKRDLNSHLSGKTLIKGFGLKFQPQLRSPAQPNLKAGGDGDGVGIGGDDQGHDPILTMEISADALENGSSAYRKLAHLKRTLPAGASLQVPYFVHVDLDQLLIEKKFIHSVGEFFTLLKSDVYQPVAINSGTKTSSTSALDRAKRTLAAIENIEKSLNEAQRYSTRQIKLVVDIIAKGEGLLIPDSVMHSLLESSEIWTLLFNTQFDTAVEINANLRALQELLRKSRP